MSNHEEGFFLSEKASKSRLREAENACKNRAEIIKALSHGKLSRRELVKRGLFTTGGMLAPIHGLNPFVSKASAQSSNPLSSAQGVPTGTPASPLFGVKDFSTPMPRFDVARRIENPMTGGLTPTPQAQSNQTQQKVDPILGGGYGPIEGRPPGDIWAHQRFDQFLPKVGYETSQAPATTNTTYNPRLTRSL